MFSSYINTFLKMKQEASGWPEWVGDDEDKRTQYVQDPDTFQSYPYGYTRAALDDTDIDNAQLLLDM